MTYHYGYGKNDLIVQYYHVYHLHPERLKQMANTLLEGDIQSKTEDSKVLKDYDAAVLETFLVDGKLTKIPVQHKKRLVILKRLVEEFDWDRKYSEKEINTKLLAFHLDSATLRREFIAWKLMEREAGIYWRLDNKVL